ncbi:MAG: polysaccharide deacetylase family protein, partial [Bacteroidia bacterium]|nr:polysaccharide deacetylase family protein [Bacteroidia bacterium]
VKTPDWVRSIFPYYQWKIATRQPEVYLTFDDGPTPGVTDFVLEQLEKYQAKATFFCVGDQVRRHPGLAKEILAAGHLIGNHTFTHRHGWKTTPAEYMAEVRQTDTIIYETLGIRPQHFRPPYGKFSPGVRNALMESHQIVMWDVLAGDFDPELSPEDCRTNIIRNYEPGSIIVLHDSQKCGDKLKKILPDLLQHFHDNGYSMPLLPKLR